MENIKKDVYKSKAVETLVKAIDHFKRYNSGLSDEGLGWKAIQDSTVVTRLRNGGDVTTKKYEDLFDFLISPPEGFLPLKTKEN